MFSKAAIVISPQPGQTYLIELCSGERRRWQFLGTTASDSPALWRDLESGLEFNESSLMYAWQILEKIDTPSNPI